MRKLFAFATLALTVIACNKEIAEHQVAPADVRLTTISASTEDLTKVALDMEAEVNLTWVDTDQIIVYDGSNANVFTVKSCSGASAVFEGSCDTAAPMLYAVYPASAYSAPGSDAIKVKVPAEQIIPEDGCVDPAALVSVGYAAPGSTMAFKQVCGLLKFTVPGSDIMEITICGKGLAGEAEANADGTLNASGASLTDEITLRPASGKFKPGAYFVAVAPGSTPAGSFSIKYRTVSSTATKTASSVVDVNRAKGVDAGTLTGFTKSETTIMTMADLFNWNSSRQGADIEDVKIGADIDMEGEPWIPKDFNGTFDGQGHKLYNLNVNRSSNACFFNTVSGTVKNLTIGSLDGTSYDGGSLIIQNNPDDNADNWRYAGLFTRLSEGAVLENIKTFVPVSVAETSTSKTRIGGLVAIVAGPATIKACENNGKVTNEAAAPSATSGSIGGLVGHADAAVRIENSVNNGDVVSASEGSTNAGGIIASDSGASEIISCDNAGAISLISTGTSAASTSVGGFVGEAKGTTVSGGSNSGTITVTYNGESKIGGIVGRINGAELPAKIKGCTNKATGTIEYNPETATKRAFIGGILGNTPASQTGAITVEDCKNYASLSGSCEQIAAIGGITGYLNGKGVVTIKGCENQGNVANTAAAAKNNTSASEAFVSGIAAYLSTSLGAGSVVDGCTNRGEISTTNRNIKTIAGIIPLFQTSNAVTLKGCHNYGAITRNVNIKATIAADSGSNYYYSIGGIVGRLNLGDGGSVSDCHNHASVWANAAGGGAQIRIAGVVGYVVKCPEIKNCSNDAGITYDNDIVQGSLIAIGGVAGHMYSTGVLDGCSNSGAISSNRSQVNRIGGVVGSVNKSSVTNCTNTGTVNLESITDSNWQGVGGIAGFAEGSSDALAFTGNVNRGNVNATVTTSAARVPVGGILGMAVTPYDISNNTNYGIITGVNNHATSPNMQVGGILGSNEDSSAVEQTLSGNVNYGAIANNVSNAAFAFAGGLYGKLDKADGASGTNYGAVTGLAAGAVAGSNTSTITATICDAVTVNGVTKANASDEAAWLCPSNTGTITPTYVAHSSSE